MEPALPILNEFNVPVSRETIEHESLHPASHKPFKIDSKAQLSAWHSNTGYPWTYTASSDSR